MTFSEQLKADIALIEPALEKYLSRETGEGYDRIFEAAKYSAMAGGKRLRPRKRILSLPERQAGNVPRGRGSGGQQRRAQQKTAACLFQDSFHDSFREFAGLFRQRVSSYAPRPEEAIGGAAGTRHAKREKKYKK